MTVYVSNGSQYCLVFPVKSQKLLFLGNLLVQLLVIESSYTAHLIRHVTCRIVSSGSPGRSYRSWPGTYTIVCDDVLIF